MRMFDYIKASNCLVTAITHLTGSLDMVNFLTQTLITMYQESSDYNSCHKEGSHTIGVIGRVLRTIVFIRRVLTTMYKEGSD